MIRWSVKPPTVGRFSSTKCKSNSFMVENCSDSSHIQFRQIFDLTDLLEKIWLFGRFKEYRFENRYYPYISRYR